MTAASDILLALQGIAGHLMAPAAVCGLWLWSATGQGGLAGSSVAHIVRQRRWTASIGLGSCLLLTLLGPRLPALLSCSLAAVVFCGYAAMEPNRTGFWYHQRLRRIGCAAAALIAAAGSVLLADAASVMPVLAAAAIYHRHLRGDAALLGRTLADVEGLRVRLLTLEVDARIDDAYPRLAAATGAVQSPPLPGDTSHTFSTATADNRDDNRFKAG